jgi:cation-transporting ATPase 13A3/4/5
MFPNDENLKCYENFVLFSVSAFQYIIMAIIFSKGRPYRKSVVTNPGLITSLIVLTLLTLYIVLWPCKGLISILELAVPPKFTFRLTLVGIAVANFILAVFIEYFVVNLISSLHIRNLQCGGSSKKRPKFDTKKTYLQVEYDLNRRTDWPPVSSYSASSPTKAAEMEKCSSVNEIMPRKLNNNNVEKEMPTIGITRHARTLSIPIPISDFQKNSEYHQKIRHSSAVEQKNLHNQLS